MQLLCSPLALVRIEVEQHNDEHYARALSRIQLEHYMQRCLLLFEVVYRLSSRVTTGFCKHPIQMQCAFRCRYSSADFSFTSEHHHSLDHRYEELRWAHNLL